MTTVTNSLLERATYEVADAARLLDVPDPTLRWWLQGKEQRGRTYLPVLRRGRNDRTVVTWGEFIEAAVLRFLRRDRQISLRELRLFMHEVRNRYPHLPHPLATDSLFVNGGRLAIADLRGIWEPATGTNFDESGARLVLEHIDWHDHVAQAYRPRRAHRDVLVNPALRGGSPMIDGVQTYAIFELVTAGLPIEMVAEEVGISPDRVRGAVGFEKDLRGMQSVA